MTDGIEQIEAYGDRRCPKVDDGIHVWDDEGKCENCGYIKGV